MVVKVDVTEIEVRACRSNGSSSSNDINKCRIFVDIRVLLLPYLIWFWKYFCCCCISFNYPSPPPEAAVGGLTRSCIICFYTQYRNIGMVEYWFVKINLPRN